MVRGAESLGSSVVVIHDPRLTPVGTFLRRTKLDELPQFINVLRGEMSFVGPRPRVPSEIDLNDPSERVLLSVRPGVTSYASIHHRMEADYCARQANPQAVYRTNLLPQKRSLDCEYVQNLTFRLDLKLLLMTFVLVCVPGRSLAGGLRILGREVRPYSRGAQMLLDLAVYMGAAWLAYTFRYEAGFPDFHQPADVVVRGLHPALASGGEPLPGDLRHDVAVRHPGGRFLSGGGTCPRHAGPVRAPPGAAHRLVESGHVPRPVEHHHP